MKTFLTQLTNYRATPIRRREPEELLLFAMIFRALMDLAMPPKDRKLKKPVPEREGFDYQKAIEGVKMPHPIDRPEHQKTLKKWLEYCYCMGKTYSPGGLRTIAGTAAKHYWLFEDWVDFCIEHRLTEFTDPNTTKYKKNYYSARAWFLSLETRGPDETDSIAFLWAANALKLSDPIIERLKKIARGEKKVDIKSLEKIMYGRISGASL